MPISPAIGNVSLDGVTFPTDPETYEPLNWKKRANVRSGLGGAKTIQDFGTFQKDNTLRLESGSQQFVDLTWVNVMHAKFRARGVTYTLLDWLGNEFVVFITEFIPIPTKNDDLWTFRMSLQVLSIPSLFSTTYTGS